MTSLSPSLELSPELAVHPAYSRVFQPEGLTFGYIMPLEGYPNSPFPTLQDHQRLARIADEAGFASLWMRDVPFYDPSFGDTGQMIDPFVYLFEGGGHDFQFGCTKVDVVPSHRVKGSQSPDSCR